MSSFSPFLPSIFFPPRLISTWSHMMMPFPLLPCRSSLFSRRETEKSCKKSKHSAHHVCLSLMLFHWKFSFLSLSGPFITDTYFHNLLRLISLVYVCECAAWVTCLSKQAVDDFSHGESERQKGRTLRFAWSSQAKASQMIQRQVIKLSVPNFSWLNSDQIHIVSKTFGPLQPAVVRHSRHSKLLYGDDW